MLGTLYCLQAEWWEAKIPTEGGTTNLKEWARSRFDD